MSKIEIEIAVEEAMRKHVAKYHADASGSGMHGVLRDAISALKDQRSEKDARIFDLEQRLAESERLAQQYLKLERAHAWSEIVRRDKDAMRIAELEQQLAEAKKLADFEGRAGAIASDDADESCARIVELEPRLADARELCDELMGYAKVEWNWKHGERWDKEYHAAFGASPLSTRCACGHPKADHYDDSDGMITDGPCQASRETGIACACDKYRPAGSKE